MELEEQIFSFIKSRPKDLEAYKDLFDVCKENKNHQVNKQMRSFLARNCFDETLWRKSLLFDTTVDFDAYARYIELDRKTKFYAPRRKQLRLIVNALQDLNDKKLDCLCISMPPGTGKTTTAEYYLSWQAGLKPQLANLIMSHNSSFLRGVYDEELRILDEAGEYLWHDVFPDCFVANKNALDMKIDINEESRFSTLTFSSIGAGNAGRVRAQGLLYCDDLIEGSEEALSPARLEKKWQLYTTDARQRKEGDCQELHIATRWSVWDPIGRIEMEHENDPRYRFIAVSALDENDETNFDYKENGFSTEFYHDMRATMDDVSWQCLYMNQPIEREGLLYQRSELRRFYELPQGEPDAIVSVCDTSNGGGDFCVLPVFYVYGSDHYLVDVVDDNGSQESRDSKCANILLKHNVQQCQFESNNAGGRTADVVEKEVKAKGGKCHITKKYTTSNKETKIVVNSPFVKTHCLFLDDTKITRGSEYYNFLNRMCSYTQLGKNKHDDEVDALAQYALFTENFRYAKATVVERMF